MNEEHAKNEGGMKERKSTERKVGGVDERTENEDNGEKIKKQRKRGEA